MKTKLSRILIAIAASLAVLPAGAQGNFNFTTSVGSGSLTLNPINLVYTGGGGGFGSTASYNSTLDSLTFNNITYTNLDFTVYNNSFMVPGGDGFQILVDKFPPSAGFGARLEINVSGSPVVVNGIATSDLMTVLNGFSALQAGSFFTSVIYNNPNPPFNQQIGTVSSFQAVPEPSTLAFWGLTLPLYLAFHRRKHIIAT